MHFLANTITADMGMIPGLAFVGPAMGLPLSVLAAFVERPSYSRAGLQRDVIWYSLQANLVSLAIGFVVTLLVAAVGDAISNHYAIFDIWPPFAVGVSIVVERWYLQRLVRPGSFNWWWTVLGNVISAALCISVLFAVMYLRAAYPELRRAMVPYAGPLQILAFVGSAGLFAIAFRQPRVVTTTDVLEAPRVARRMPR